MTAITYRPLTFPALLALELPVLQWIVDELLPRGSLTLFSGREKGGKSLLMFSLAVCVAQGRGFLGRSVRAGPVLLVPAEEHLREVRDRLRRLLGEAQDALVHVLPVNRGEDDALDLADPAAIAELRRVIGELRPSLLVLDPFRELHNRSENEADEMGPLLRPLRQLAHDTDTAVVLIHHMSKLNNFRGSTAIRAAVDQSWELRSPEEATDESTELRGTLTVKGRFGQKQVLGVRLAEDLHWQLAAGAPAPPRSARSQILAYLTAVGEPATAEAIAGAVGVETKTVQNILGEERRGGRSPLIITGSGRKGEPFRYALNPTPEVDHQMVPDPGFPREAGSRESNPTQQTRPCRAPAQEEPS